MTSNLLESIKNMLAKHLCPCCSQPLLRHTLHKRAFWFCSHCYQERPDWTNVRETLFDRHRWIVKPLPDPQRIEGYQQDKKPYSCCETKKELQRLARLDSLTQTANRLRFQAYVEQNWQQMVQEQAPLSLILGNIDFFKIYNEIYGHEAGNQCLQRVADVVTRTLMRPADLVPRYGGEEFVIILPHTNGENAVRVADDIRCAVKELKIALANSHEYLTVSFGVASLVPQQESSSRMLMIAADRALDRAKKLGRDRIIVDESLLRQTQAREEKALPLSQDNKNSSVPLCLQENGATTKIELLKSYVAYYVSRGNTVTSPFSGTLPFEESVYQYWGYHDAFQDFWKQLISRRDFFELYLEGDDRSFGQVLCQGCTIRECSRCNLPIAMPDGQAYSIPNCTLCQPPDRSQSCSIDCQCQSGEHKSDSLHLLAIGTPPTDCQELKKLFSLNGFEVTFASTPEDIIPQPLPHPVDWVLIYEAVSEAQGKAWAHQLTRYPQFQGVPIVALSSEAGGGLPWRERTLELEDYILSPQGGDRLAHYLRHSLQPKHQNNTPDLYWFPR
jgi:diguanylate cyclase (GGDEF)-like protein